MQSRRNFIKCGTTVFAGALMSNPQKLMAKSPNGIAGELAPELEVPYWIDGDGQPTKAFSIAENKGKWVILKCFQNWCPGCHSHGFPALQKLVAEFGENDQVKFAAIQTTFEG